MKIVIIVLILIIAVFVIFTVRGSLRDEPAKSEAAEFVKNKETPDWSKMIGRLLAPMSKKMSLPCAKPAPEKADFQCAELNLNKDLLIAAEPETSFRTVKFILFQGNAHIRYRDRTKKSADFKLREQDFDLPNTDTEDPKIGSIVALEDGGIVRISCIGNQPCQVGQQ